MLVTLEVQTHETSLALFTLVLRVCSSTTIYCLPFITAVSDTLAVGHFTVTPLESKQIGEILNVIDVFCETIFLDRSVPETVAEICNFTEKYFNFAHFCSRFRSLVGLKSSGRLFRFISSQFRPNPTRGFRAMTIFMK